jgi:hypothetical protein
MVVYEFDNLSELAPPKRSCGCNRIPNFTLASDAATPVNKPLLAASPALEQRSIVSFV